MKLVLIGMPGCGKTSIGRLVSEKLRFKFIDLDEEIVRSASMSINEIFAKLGEERFRELETDALKKSLESDNAVISTGGGIVKLDRNVKAIKNMGGYTVFIDRPLSLIIGDIDTSERPLLKDGADRLKNLYAERYELYKAAADTTAVNDGSIEDIVEDIEDIVNKR